jgi:hypothetical protein
MTFVAGVLLALTTLAIVARFRVHGSLDANSLGWMSERWLAEYRASHPV